MIPMEPSARIAPLASGVLLRRIAPIFMPLCMVLLWPLMRPYDGLDRDGQLYAVQAMEHAHPGRYTNDLFFLFGSQDSFTILTRLVSPLYRWLGLDHASALLTVVGALLWWSACWLLARTVAGPRIAWVSLVLVMAAPGWYGGGGEVFQYAETYFGARLPAEAMVLLALALHHMGRPILGSAALAIAFVIHPLMTVPGLAMFALLQSRLTRWPWLVLLAASLLALMIGVAILVPLGRLRLIDPEWLNILTSRSSFLFPFEWSELDWQRTVSVICLLLAVSRLVLSARTKRVALAGAVIATGGMLCAVVIGEFAPVELLLQAQPWRTLWLASVLAYMLVPLAIVDGWRADPYSRASAILLVAAVCALNPATILTSSIVSLALATLPNRTALPHGRLVVMGSAAAAALTVLFSVLSALTVTKIPAWGGESSATVEILRNMFGLVVPGVGVALGLLLLTRGQITLARFAIASLVLGTLAAMTAGSVGKEFSAKPYTGLRHAQFADWRDRIPPGTNVLWPGSPVYPWFLLDRPSYISVSQLAGVIFSRDLAIESLDRIRSLQGFANEDALLRRPGAPERRFANLTLELLYRICQDQRIGFVVAPVHISANAPSKPWPDEVHRIYLYDCRTHRAQAENSRIAGTDWETAITAKVDNQISLLRLSRG